MREGAESVQPLVKYIYYLIDACIVVSAVGWQLLFSGRVQELKYGDPQRDEWKNNDKELASQWFCGYCSCCGAKVSDASDTEQGKSPTVTAQ